MWAGNPPGEAALAAAGRLDWSVAEVVVMAKF
jgi:hypothetical protein